MLHWGLFKFNLLRGIKIVFQQSLFVPMANLILEVAKPIIEKAKQFKEKLISDSIA